MREIRLPYRVPIPFLGKVLGNTILNLSLYHQDFLIANLIERIDLSLLQQGIHMFPDTLLANLTFLCQGNTLAMLQRLIKVSCVGIVVLAKDHPTEPMGLPVLNLSFINSLKIQVARVTYPLVIM